MCVLGWGGGEAGVGGGDGGGGGAERDHFDSARLSARLDNAALPNTASDAMIAILSWLSQIGTLKVPYRDAIRHD